MAGNRDRLLRARWAGPGPEAPPESLRKQILLLVVAGGFSLALGLASSDGVLHGLDGYPWPLRVADVVFGGIGYVALWWRRRRPMAFAAYVLVVSLFSTLVGGLPLVAALTVAIHRNWPTALVTSALLTAVAWPSLLLYPGDSSAEASMLTVAVAMFAVTGWGMFLRARRLLLASLRGRAERAEQSREEHARHARIAERQRIAREMHDVLAHRPSLLSGPARALGGTPAGGGGRGRGGHPAYHPSCPAGTAFGGAGAARRRRGQHVGPAAGRGRPAHPGRRVLGRGRDRRRLGRGPAGHGAAPGGPDPVPGRAGGPDQRAQARPGQQRRRPGGGQSRRRAFGDRDLVAAGRPARRLA